MNPTLALPLSTSVVVLLVACGGSSQHKAASATVSPDPIQSKCSSYFGGGVAVALCSAHGRAPLTIDLHQPGARSGSAPATAQAMGSPLRDGERFEIGPTPDGAELLARVFVSSPRRVASVQFKLPPTTESERLRLQVSGSADDIAAALQLGSGKELTATRIYLPRVS